MNNKKFSKIIPVLVILMLILSPLFILTSCGGDEVEEGGITDMFIAKNSGVRQIYVVGQDLDLTKGNLTVVIDGANTELALNAEGVSVTGYNSETAGVQEITVKYLDFTTTFKVTVIPRISPENYETDYFVGDEFNKTKGRLKVARDDGTTFLVNMSDESVSLKSFNPISAGTCAVTVEYAKDGVSYECTFNVNVHTAETIVFTPPTKRSYSSHEEQLDLTGGYFTVKAASPSNLSKMVVLTQSMVTGYNPDSVTIANRTEPVTQTILVNYAGYSNSFDVSVIYSSVKIVREQAQKLVNIDYEKAWEDITLPQGAGTAAFDGIQEYFKLSSRDKELVGDDLVNALVKAATFYLTGRYESELDSLSNVFVINFRQNAYLIVGETPTVVKMAIDTLEDESSNFNVIASLLTSIKEEFGNDSFNSSYSIKNVFNVHTDEMMNNSSNGILTSLKQIIKVYDFMSSFPENWDDTTLKEYEANILDAASAIRLSQMRGPAYESLYGVIRAWRADFFDIIYSYYFNVLEVTDEEERVQIIGEKVWNVIPAPSKLNVWYTSYNNVYSFLFSQDSNAPGLYYSQNSGRDLFEFHYFYNVTVKIGNEILQGPDDANRKMYLLLGGNSSLDVIKYVENVGYVNLMNTALGDAAVEKTWNSYLILLDLVYNNNGQISEALLTSNSAYFEDFAKNLASLTPTQLHNFLSSTYYRYNYAHSIGAPQSDAFEFTNYSPQNYATYLLANYFSTKLTPNGMIVLQQILSSMEQASLMHVKDAATDNFKAAAGNLVTNYLSTNLARSDFDVLSRCFGEAVNRCDFIYNQLTGQNPVGPTDGEKLKLDELNEALNAFDAALQKLNELNAIDLTNKTEEEKAAINQEKSDVFAIIIATFDNVDVVFNRILGSNDNSKFHLCTYKYSAVVNEETVRYILDTRIVTARFYFLSCMISSGIGDSNAWDVYNAYGVKGEIAKLLPLLQAEFNGELLADALDYKAIFDSFNINCKIGTLMTVGRLYSAGLQRYYNSLLSDENKALELTEKLLTAEQLYWAYKATNNEDALSQFNTAMSDAIEAYATVTDEAQKENLDTVLGELYTDYLAFYNELNPTEEPAA